MKVVAKGARGPKSHFYGTLEPLNYVSIVFYFKQTRELQLVTQASINQTFLKIRDDLLKYAMATFFCELIDRTQMEEPNKYLFQIFLDVLDALNRAEEKKKIEILFSWFLLRFLYINGFKPDFDRCTLCEKEEITSNVRFSITDGRFTCNSCEAVNSNTITTDSETLYDLRHLQRVSVKKAVTLNYTSPESCEILLLNFLQYHIEETTRLKSLKFLKTIHHEIAK